MNKDIFVGLIGILSLVIYVGKGVIALFLALAGNYETAVQVLLVGMVLETIGFTYTLRA